MKVELLTREDLKRLEGKIDEVVSMLSEYIPSRGNRKCYNTRELCERLNVSAKTVYDWRQQKLIRYSQVNRRIFYTEDAISEFLSSHVIKRRSS